MNVFTGIEVCAAEYKAKKVSEYVYRAGDFIVTDWFVTTELLKDSDFTCYNPLGSPGKRGSFYKAVPVPGQNWTVFAEDEIRDSNLENGERHTETTAYGRYIK